MKILTVIGARPQFVKAAVLSREFMKGGDVNEILLHTGQHFDDAMSSAFFRELEIPAPKYNLGVNSASPSQMTGRMMSGIEEIIGKENPDAILVYGDTFSTLAGALAAVQQNKKLIHVEAGLRSNDLTMPEEVNRVLTDRISNLLFCPTSVAMENLRDEGFDLMPNLYFESGDVMFDSFLYYKDKINADPILQSLNIQSPFILCTFHRAANTDNAETLTEIVNALNQINETIPVVVPVHPRTKNALKASGVSVSFRMIPPVSYFETLALLSACESVITDSGGLQKEAYFSGKKSLCLRYETEWRELAESGYVILAGNTESSILESYENLASAELTFNEKFYGEGSAASFIKREILNAE